MCPQVITYLISERLVKEEMVTHNGRKTTAYYIDYQTFVDVVRWASTLLCSASLFLCLCSICLYCAYLKQRPCVHRYRVHLLTKTLQIK
jgi:C4-dicarboxylate transporter